MTGKRKRIIGLKAENFLAIGRVNQTICLLLVLMATPLVVTSVASADVVYLKSGKTIVGLSKIDPKDSDIVVVITDRVEYKFRRSDIVKIERQPEYKNRIDLGEAFLKRNEKEKALEQFKLAAQLNPGAEEVQEALRKIEAVNRLMEEEALQERLRKSEAILEEISEAIAERDFIKAEASWQRGSELNPNPEQLAALNTIRVDLYYQWAMERLDRIDTMGAMDKLETLLAFNPENEQAKAKLIELYEKEPAKIDIVLAYWQENLLKNPEDIALQVKVAELLYKKKDLPNALPHFLIAYQTGEFAGTDVERKLTECFDEKHDLLARTNKFEEALLCYRQYKELFPAIDDEPLKLYEYAVRISKINPNNLDQLLMMGDWSREQGLHNHAERLYQHVFSIDKENKKAMAGLQFYADNLLNQAQQAFTRAS